MCSEAGQKGLYFWFQEHPVKASRDPSPFRETRDGPVGQGLMDTPSWKGCAIL